MAPRSTTSRSLQFLSNTQEETEDLSGTVFSRTLCVHGCEATSGFGTKLTQRVPTTWHQHYTVLINAEPIFWWSLLVSIIVSQAEVSQKNCRIDILSHPEYKAEHGNTSHLRKHLVKLQIHLTESWTLWHEQHLHLYVILLFFVCTHVRFDQSRWLKNQNNNRCVRRGQENIRLTRRREYSTPQKRYRFKQNPTEHVGRCSGVEIISAHL